MYAVTSFKNQFSRFLGVLGVMVKYDVFRSMLNMFLECDHDK